MSLNAAPTGIDTAAVQRHLEALDGVTAVHDLHIWRVGDSQTFLSCHVALPAETSLHGCADVLRLLNEKLHREFGIEHATIQTEIDGLCDRSPAGRLYCEIEPRGRPVQGEHAHCHTHGH